MKHTIIIAAVALIICTGAKTIICRSDTAQPSHTIQTLGNVTALLRDDRILFHALPAGDIAYYVIGTDRSVAASGKLSKNRNAIITGKLPAGSYSIALMQGAAIKVFGYCTAVAVTAHRV